MLSLIEDYEQQYALVSAETTSQLCKLNNLPIGAERRSLIANIDSHLQEAHELLEQIGLEIREADPSLKPSLISKLNCYQAELKRLQHEFNIAKTNRPTVNPAFEEDDYYDDVGMGEDQKRRLLDNSERLERVGNHLNDAYRVAIETQEIGNGVLRELHGQRETITRTRSRLRETDADLGRSSRILNSMFMRYVRDKFIVFGIGGVFIVVVLLSIYLSW